MKSGRAAGAWLALAFVAPLASGCLALPASPAPGPILAKSGILQSLATVPPPSVNATRARLWWDAFVRGHPDRVTQSPTNIDAANTIERDLTSMGYQTKVLYFVPGTGSPAPAGEGVRTIVAIRPGRALPDHVIAWAAHYDTTATTVYGAYDDGSGTGVAMEIARVFASYPNNKTVMALFFDAEEEGLLGSSYFVKEATGNKNATFDFFVGLDMTGINCPGYKWPMVQFIGAKYDADVKPVLEAVDGAKLSSAANRCIAWEDSDPRSSDELSFQSAGVPILRLAGGFNASDYPAYHMPTDTVDYVYNFTGGPERYEAGVNLTVSAAYWALAAFDRSPPLT